MGYTNYKKPATTTTVKEEEKPKNEVATTTTMTIEALLDSPAVKSLGQSLRLTNAQIAKANSAVLRLQADSKLQYCTVMSKIRFAYSVATFDYKHPNAVAPVAYKQSIQAQIQYQGLIEDMYACGGVKETNWTPLFKGVKYEVFINKQGQKELKDIPIVELGEDIFAKPEIIGYYAYAKCKNGKTYTCLMSNEEIEKWALRYSVSYKQYKEGEAKSAIWDGNKQDMAIKTVVKVVARAVLKEYPFDRLAKAIELDQAVFSDSGVSYDDNPQNATKQAENTIKNRLTKPEEKKVEEVDVKPVEEAKQA